MFGLECLVFMVKASYQQKPYRRVLMETFGATVRPHPAPPRRSGKKVLGDPDSSGSLGIAISEAIESRPPAGHQLRLGSVADHVLLHQTVLGQEAQKQMEMAGESPDVVIGAWAGVRTTRASPIPSWQDWLTWGSRPGSWRPSRRRAPPDQGSVPLRLRGHGRDAPVPMYTMGHTFVPAPVHAGGLVSRRRALALHVGGARAHGGSGVHAEPGVRGGVQFARAQGIVPARSQRIAIRAVIDEAVQARDSGQ